MGRGNNHYDDCRCGWCTSTWVNAQIYHDTMRRSITQQDAHRVLREFKATEGFAKYFVNPNAQCPSCGVAVFYYQNEYGSRVYFDQLGPPWPKHPCTDGMKTQTYETQVHRPAARRRGERIELVGAARQIGEYEGVRVAPAGYPIDWQMVEIMQVNRTVARTMVKGRLLQQDQDEMVVYFSVENVESFYEVGDVLSACFSHVSFFDIMSFAVRSLIVQWYRDENYISKLTVTHTPIQNAPSVSPESSHDLRDAHGSMTLIRREDAPKWLKKSVEKQRNKRQQKNKKKSVAMCKKPAPRAVATLPSDAQESGLDRQEMMEILSQRFKITHLKDK